jgi:hypothetical protein
MKGTDRTGLFLLVILGWTLTAAAASVSITVDENCNGTLVNPITGTFTLPCALKNDAGREV